MRILEASPLSSVGYPAKKSDFQCLSLLAFRSAQSDLESAHGA